jgi:hypothetical protein
VLGLIGWKRKVFGTGRSRHLNHNIGQWGTSHSSPV